MASYNINGIDQEVVTVQPGGIVDGGDVTQGSKADVAASAGSLPGSFSVVALLKGLLAAVTNEAVTEADGANVTQGAKADAAATNPGTAAPWSVVALLKAIWIGVNAATPAGTNKIGGVTIASGDDATAGSTTDAPLAAAASTSANTVTSVLKGLFNLFFNGTARVLISTAVARNTSAIPSGTAASGTYQTAVFDTGVAAGSPAPYASYKASLNPNQTGTAQFLYSNNGTTFVAAGAPIAVAAAAWTTLVSPIYGRYVALLWTNGSTATTAAGAILEQLSAV